MEPTLEIESINLSLPEILEIIHAAYRPYYDYSERGISTDWFNFVGDLSDRISKSQQAFKPQVMHGELAKTFTLATIREGLSFSSLEDVLAEFDLGVKGVEELPEIALYSRNVRFTVYRKDKHYGASKASRAYKDGN